jgi:hypothetical protein
MDSNPNGRELIGAFAALAVAATVLVVMLVGGGLMELLSAFGGGIVTAAIVISVYKLGARAGHPHSHAVAEAAIALGVLYTIGLVARLLTEFGA